MRQATLLFKSKTRRFIQGAGYDEDKIEGLLFFK
jgi:hypothetical protein